MGTRGRKAGLTDTRERILSAALAQFREKGFAQTTMRGVCAEAGVSLGNAYYYFPSKEHLILNFYSELLIEQKTKLKGLLERKESLKDKLISMIRIKMSTIEPHRDLFIGLFCCAGDPASPLNPFSKESESIRVGAVELFAQGLAHSDVNVSNDLKPILPHLLWMYYMGIILFWIQDKSFGRRRTNRLLEISAGIVASLIAVSSSPLLFEVRRQVLNIWHDIVEDDQP